MKKKKYTKFAKNINITYLSKVKITAIALDNNLTKIYLRLEVFFLICIKIVVFLIMVSLKTK